MMKQGTHKVTPTTAFLGESKNQTAYIGIVFENQENEKITHKLWINSTKQKGGTNAGKTNAEVAFKTLADCGFTGDADDLHDESATGLFRPVTGGIELVVVEEEYHAKDQDGNEQFDDDGEPVMKTYSKIEYLNIGGGSREKRLEKDMAKKVNTKYKANAYLAKFKKSVSYAEVESTGIDFEKRSSAPAQDSMLPDDDDCPF